MNTCNNKSDEDTFRNEYNDDMGETDEYHNFIPTCYKPLLPSDATTPSKIIKSFGTLKEALQYNVQHAKFDLAASLAHILPASKNDVSDDVSKDDNDIVDEDDLINNVQSHTTLQFLNYAQEHVRIIISSHVNAPAEFLQNLRTKQMFTSVTEFSENQSNNLYLSLTLENNLVTAALYVQLFLEETIEAEVENEGKDVGDSDVRLKEQIALLQSELCAAKTNISCLTNSTVYKINTAATKLVKPQDNDQAPYVCRRA